MSDLRTALSAVLGERHVVERELGGGGMLRVFLCRDTTLDRHPSHNEHSEFAPLLPSVPDGWALLRLRPPSRCPSLKPVRPGTRPLSAKTSSKGTCELASSVCARGYWTLPPATVYSISRNAQARHRFALRTIETVTLCGGYREDLSERVHVAARCATCNGEDEEAAVRAIRCDEAGIAHEAGVVLRG